jgi:homoserine dehydrogenase
MSDPIKIGIAGLGTVGAGLIKIIQKNSDILNTRVGRSIEIVAVSALSKTKDRGVDLSSYQWEKRRYRYFC